jgi:hypothetical protein
MAYSLENSSNFYNPPDESVTTNMVLEDHYKDLVAMVAILNKLRKMEGESSPDTYDVRATLSEGLLKIEYWNGSTWVSALEADEMTVGTLNVDAISVATLETGGVEFLTKVELIKWRCLLR